MRRCSHALPRHAAPATVRVAHGQCPRAATRVLHGLDVREVGVPGRRQRAVDQVVVDQGLVTSRNPYDIPAFNEKLVEEIAEGVHAGQRT